MTTATINSGDGTWYLHVQGRDLAGNLSNVMTVSALIDNTAPGLNVLTRTESDNRKSITWNWNANESNCLYRFDINQDQQWSANGEFSAIKSIVINNKDGLWYIHVQAIDLAGNESEIVTDSYNFGIPDQEREALIDLYHATDGDHWINHSQWLGEIGTECNWYGITCNPEQSHVIALDLDNDSKGNNLVGKLAPSIGNLAYLDTMDVSENHIHSLTSTIQNLTHLTNLDLSSNALSNIPPEIGNLVLLCNLYVNGNKISQLPSEIKQLKALNTASFHYNQLDRVDSEITDFLDTLNHDWNKTQTISPEQFTITTITDHAIRLSWSAIDYTGHAGGYEINYRENSNAPYTICITENKSTQQKNLTGLRPDTSYAFKIRTVTYPHTDGPQQENNKNTLHSQFTKEIVARTYALPTAQIAHPLTDYINTQDIQLNVTGKDLVAYAYKLGNNAWSEEFLIDAPIVLTDLDDGAYQLLIKGKNECNTWQSAPTIVEWIVDTHVDNFSIDPSDWTDSNLCLWALAPEDITISGKREPDSTVSIECDGVNDTQIIYPDNQTWVSNLLDMPTGQYTVWVHLTDIAGNRSTQIKKINRYFPAETNIVVSSDSLLADNISKLPIEIAFYTHDHKKICVNQSIQLTSTMGHIMNQTISNDVIRCDLKADDQTGSAIFSVLYQNAVLAAKTIEMIPGPADRFVFDRVKDIQQVDIPGDFIQIFVQDAHGHTVSVSNDINIKLTSTAGTHARFFVSKGEFWEAFDTQIAKTLKAGTDHLTFMYQASVPGTFTVSTSNSKLIDSSMNVQVIVPPIAVLKNPPSAHSGMTDYSFTVQGDHITHYQYQLDNTGWHSETHIDTPIVLSDVTEGEHRLLLIGKNILNKWQLENAATSMTWEVDITPPDIVIALDTTGSSFDKNWTWSASETNCTFRYAIDREPMWIADKKFNTNTNGQKSASLGTWYIHVQAMDQAGNISDIFTESATFNAPIIEFTSVDSEYSENQNSILLEIQLSHAVDQDIVVHYQPDASETIDQLATFHLDYTLPTIQSAVIHAGNTKGSIQLQIIDDDISEIQEKIVIELTDTVANIGDNSTHTILITDNDEWGIMMTKTSDKPIIVENGKPENMSIVLNSRPESQVVLTFTSDAHSLTFQPETITFSSDQWNIAQNVLISYPDDTAYRGNIDITVFVTPQSDDSMYNDKVQSTHFQLQENDQSPLPPQITCPDIPYNHKEVQLCWESGGGTGLYQYLIDDRLFLPKEGRCYTDFSGLPDGFHTFSIQEKNEYTDVWSGSAECRFEIDTGSPCSIPESPQAVDILNSHFTITYRYNDGYEKESCWDSLKGSGVTAVELWVAAPGESVYTRFAADHDDQIDGYFEYTATTEGAYRFITRAFDRANNAEMQQLPLPSDEWESETIYSKDFSGYALLTVGAVTNQEGIESHTLSAKNIYRHLVNQHFGLLYELSDPLDHIKYLNIEADEWSDPFELDLSQTTKLYKESLKNSITQWAFDKMTALPGPLYIILIDHGAPDAFYFGRDTTTVSSIELDGWISTLENDLKKNNIPMHEIVIVIDTCYSGSFINELSSYGRIIITSTTENEVSFRGPKTPGKAFVRDGAYFASNLFNELSKGLSLSQSFNRAVYLTEMLTSSQIYQPVYPFFDTAAQHPLMDDDGNQIGHNSMYVYGDGYTSDDIYLGNAKAYTLTVEIVDAQILPDNILENGETSLDFKVLVNDQTDVGKVCVEIKEPNTIMPTYVDESRQKILKLKQTCLEWNDNAYTGSFEYFIDPGKYTLFFYVEDQKNIITYFDETVVYKKALENNPPLAFHLIRPINLNDPENQGSNETESQQVIFEWENTRDPENDSFTYRFFLSKSSNFEQGEQLTIIKDNIIHEQILMTLPVDAGWDDRELYWKVSAVDEYGAYTDTETFMFKTNHFSSAPTEQAIVIVHVYDSITKQPVPGAIVTFTCDTHNFDLTMRQSGRYIERFKDPAFYNVSIQANGYETQNESVEIIKNKNQSLDFDISYIFQTGDLNKDRNVDLKDVIMCLQRISE
jgi:Leucine-rich repeat (LRR) protein